MEAIFIAGIIGFIGGAVLMWFMKDKVVSIDQSLHAKVAALENTVITAANQLGAHVTKAVESLKAPETK